MISFAVTAKLICVFVFAYADCWVCHEAAPIKESVFPNEWHETCSTFLCLISSQLSRKRFFFLINSKNSQIYFAILFSSGCNDFGLDMA